MGLERLIEAAQPPLLAQAEAIAGRLAGMTRAALYADAAQWATQLRAANRVLGCRTALLGAAPCVVAEALGSTVDWERELVGPAPAPATLVRRASTRWTALLGTLERLVADRGGSAVVAALPGPAALAHSIGLQLTDTVAAQLKPALVTLAEDICRLRPDLLLLREDVALAPGELPPAYRRLFGTVRNIARYFDVPLGLAVGTTDAASLDAVARLQPDVVLLTIDAAGTLPGLDAVARISATVPLVGVPVALTDPEGSRARVHRARERLTIGRWCVCTAAELPANIDLGAVRALLNELETV
jgi:hypothetical protein